MLPDASHRPSPAPNRPWAMFMRWVDLAFIHWRVSASSLQPLVPDGLAIDSFDGTAWIGVVPFRMEGIRHRLLPPIPGLRAFCELNVRTYVSCEGKPGVWFFSLDAASSMAVKVARRTFHLPYFYARMSANPIVGGGIRYRSFRREEPGAEFLGDYRPISDARRSAPGSLAYFLTERYCLYSADSGGGIWRGEILHEPWPLQAGEVEIERSTMLQALGLAQPKERPVVHFARRLDVVAWRPEACFVG